MPIYTFATNLLSAEKTGYPNLIGTTLSGVGVSFLSGSNGNQTVFATQNVVIQSLSTTDVGIAFNPVQVSVASTALSTFKLSSYPLSTVNILGSVFTIPTQLNNTAMAIVENVAGTFSVFTHLSTTATLATSALSTERNVSTADTRRKRNLGY
jgi:hypothetical protein